MNKKFGEVVFLGLFIGGMSVALIISPVWYLIPFLIALFLSLWYIGKIHGQYIVAALLCGEISCATAWYSSPWFAWIIQVAIFGLLQNRLRIPDTRQEIFLFIALSGSLAIITSLSDWMNHTSSPVLVVICVTVLVILFILTAEFRLQRKYSGEKL
ncbi:MAG: hypothetical protein CVV33_05895 [Methanomicrobiales archaeon HGW-Methanomicrobiales-4]|nr:MAG: hypothetical protein CVV33_05895 [Methanomicrobiales archaeon HGW-Methanomicrobiales-4]